MVLRFRSHGYARIGAPWKTYTLILGYRIVIDYGHAPHHVLDPQCLLILHLLHHRCISKGCRGFSLHFSLLIRF